MRNVIAGLLILTASLGAQGLKFPASFDELAKKAENVVDVTLDAAALELASQFLSQEKGEEGNVKEVVKGLKAIYVRSFEFAEEGQYTEADVDAIRSQFRGAEWTPIVNVRSRKKGSESTQILIKKQDDKIAGLAVLAAEPKELTVVYLEGLINPSDLAKLGGNFGIPKMNMGPVKDKEKEN